ncbi:MAG: LuxR C-terminal-related transcriptional regulator [Anaerovoracaceae bacterium]
MRIILLDDHLLFGKTLQKIFVEEGYAESFTFVHSEEELFVELEKNENAIVFLDINLNKLGIEDSFELAKTLVVRYTNIKTAFLSGYNLPMYRRMAQKIGAKGFFSKEIDIKELLSGLRIIESGGSFFNEEDFAGREALTHTEIKILTLSAKGYSRDGIAEELDISNRTVGRHLSNIFEKLEAKNINQAVAIALDNGYIPPLY